MLTLILGWKTPQWTKESPELLYCGNDGTAAVRVGQEAVASGKYAKGKIGRVLVTTLIPVTPLATGIPKALFAAKAQQAAVAAPAQPKVKPTK